MLFQYGQLVLGINTTTASGGTVTLTNVSKQIQALSTSGSNGETYVLPDATTMTAGQYFEFFNNAAGSMIINYNGGTTLYTVIPGSSIVVTLVNNGSSNGTWSALSSGSGTGGQPTISTVTLTSHTGGFSANASGTYTPPSGTKYIKVRLVGGGGGGASSSNASASINAGGSGGDTTFGTSLLVANGGAGGASNTNGGAGGTASLGSGPIGLAFIGGRGQGGNISGTSGVYTVGGSGASSPFGGAGGGGSEVTAGYNAAINTGSGGGGAGGPSPSGGNSTSGGGGGAGGFVDAIITSPSSTYSYSVGTAGTSATAGSGGQASGSGGSGVIIVEEYYF